MHSEEPQTVVIGGGPAGLSSAWELCRRGVRPVVLEAGGIAGGLARTEQYKGFLFDIGGHRFYTKVPLVQRVWDEIMGPDMLTRPRLSRIYYRSRFFRYPLEPVNAAAQLGVVETLRCMLSYAHARLFPLRPETDFAAWVTNRFGSRLFEIFFRSYTEKVWGMKCSEISADWAAQRIRGLSLTRMLHHAIQRSKQTAGSGPKSLINEFQYPRLGPGMMWTRMASHIAAGGGEVLYNHAVERISWVPGRVTAVSCGADEWAVNHCISSMPLRELVRNLDPAPPRQVLDAASRLRYRDFLTVVLMVRGRDLFPDNWIYIHEPSVRVGRIQNYGNWSPEMVPDPDTTCLGLEYFCFENDGLWSASDSELLELGKRELQAIGLAEPASVFDGTVLRVHKAYPVYDSEYAGALDVIRGFLDGIHNLQVVGRNGMHHYNNQDHSMLTGILAARNLLGSRYDLWKINTDPEYLESDPIDGSAGMGGLASGERMVPRAIGQRAR